MSLLPRQMEGAICVTGLCLFQLDRREMLDVKSIYSSQLFTTMVNNLFDILTMASSSSVFRLVRRKMGNQGRHPIVTNNVLPVSQVFRVSQQCCLLFFFFCFSFGFSRWAMRYVSWMLDSVFFFSFALKQNLKNSPLHCEWRNTPTTASYSRGFPSVPCNLTLIPNNIMVIILPVQKKILYDNELHAAFPGRKLVLISLVQSPCLSSFLSKVKLGLPPFFLSDKMPVL